MYDIFIHFGPGRMFLFLETLYYYMNELGPIMCFQNEAPFLNMFWNADLSSSMF